MLQLKIYWLLLAGFIGCFRWIYWLFLAGFIGCFRWIYWLLSLDLLAAFAGPSLTVFAAANKLRFLVTGTLEMLEVVIGLHILLYFCSMERADNIL